MNWRCSMGHISVGLLVLRDFVTEGSLPSLGNYYCLLKRGELQKNRCWVCGKISKETWQNLLHWLHPTVQGSPTSGPHTHTGLGLLGTGPHNRRWAWTQCTWIILKPSPSPHPSPWKTCLPRKVGDRCRRPLWKGDFQWNRRQGRCFSPSSSKATLRTWKAASEPISTHAAVSRMLGKFPSTTSFSPSLQPLSPFF